MEALDRAYRLGEATFHLKGMGRPLSRGELDTIFGGEPDQAGEPSVSNVVPFLSGLKPPLLPEEEVTISRLSAILEAAFIDYEIDETGDLFVTDGLEYPLWVTIDSAGKFLHLFTYHEIDEEPEADWLSRINRMNETLIVTRFYRMDDAIWGDYSMSFEGGLMSVSS